MNDLASGISNIGYGAKKFGTKEANFTAFQTLYALAQGTADLSGSDCSSCLQIAISNLQGCCGGQQGGRVLSPSCNVRFELYRFYQLVAPVPPPPGSVSTPNGKVFSFWVGGGGKKLDSNKLLIYRCLSSLYTTPPGRLPPLGYRSKVDFLRQ